MFPKFDISHSPLALPILVILFSLEARVGAYSFASIIDFCERTVNDVDSNLYVFLKFIFKITCETREVTEPNYGCFFKRT